MPHVTWQLVCLLAAVVCAAVFTVIGFGWFWDDTGHPFGWLGLAVTLGLVSRVP